MCLTQEVRVKAQELEVYAAEKKLSLKEAAIELGESFPETFYVVSIRQLSSKGANAFVHEREDIVASIFAHPH